MHRIPTDRPGDDVSQDDPSGKLFGEKKHDTGDRGTQNLADADLLGSLFGSKRSESENPQTGDKNGDERKVTEDSPQFLFGLVEVPDSLIKETVFIWIVRRITL